MSTVNVYTAIQLSNVCSQIRVDIARRHISPTPLPNWDDIEDACLARGGLRLRVSDFRSYLDSIQDPDDRKWVENSLLLHVMDV